MKVTFNGKTQELWTLWREGTEVKMIDQRLLPHRFEILTLHNHSETAEAIRDMATRGAGAIGVAGGYGVAQAALEAQGKNLKDFKAYVTEAADTLRKTRPTAVNLFHAIDRCIKAASKGSVAERVAAACAEADRIALEDLEASKNMGEYGNALIKDGFRILTHCNAGALAFIDNGSALAPIRVAHRAGKHIFVYADETRPRSQGAKLTAWELQQEGIPYALIADNAAGHYMHRGEVDFVVVGADRIAANGDTANKIGTYEKAVLARENGIPFYVAAPRMTFDLKCPTGDGIEIEERSPDEVNWVWGADEKGNYMKVRISAEGTVAKNPSFDVTPAKYITGFITEVGVINRPFRGNIRRAFREHTMHV
ncbi:MAG: S-methyl-5-thioribose-1-phosphate isomerase [Candidatus Bathyarchaeota archaeon]|nr:S-methyl-5-thioribose-1-phosphate isomerase [Candidatus Bathyarchaeota archaeon]